MSIAELEGAYGPSSSEGSHGLVPPQDVDAERSVLGGMLLSKDAIADAAEAVDGSDFYRPAHEQIYEAIVELYGRGEPADAITVADELTKRGELQRVGGQAYLHELIQSVPTAANAGYYASIVAERAVLRRLVEAGTRITQMGYADGAGDVVDVINAAQAEIFGVTAGKEAEDYVRIGDVIEATADEIDAASGTAGQMTGVPTGFTDLDALTNGLHGGQMIVVAARPAVGKALALDTPLPTPTGWTTMGEVVVGDQLVGADGRPTRVVAATEVMTGRPCYEVEFSDGTVIVADEQHQWLVSMDGDDAGVETTGVLRQRLEAGATLAITRDAVSTPPLVEQCLALPPLVEPDRAVLSRARNELVSKGAARRGPCRNPVTPADQTHPGWLSRSEPLGEGRVETIQAPAPHPGNSQAWKITEIRPIRSVPVRCVEVDNESHLYLASRSMIPTHNSTLGLDIARAASIKNNMSSVVFSLEMSKTEITMRLLSAEAGIQLQHMRKGTMRDEDWTKLAATMGRIADAPLFIDDSPNMSLMEIRSKCRRLKERNNLKLVIIDYLQLMTSGKRVESRQQEVSEFSRALKLLAKEIEVPVIAISQLNRGPEQRTDKRPQMSDLRESGSIEQDADMVILLHREDSYDKDSERAGEADLIVAKHRNGPTDTITVAFQGHYSRFTNMAQNF